MKSIIVPLVTLILLGLASCKYDNLEVVKPELPLNERFEIHTRAGGFSYPNTVDYLFQVKNRNGRGKSGLTEREIFVKVPDSYLYNGEGREHTLENLDASEIEVYAVIAIDNSGRDPNTLEEMKSFAIGLVNSFGLDVNMAVYSIGGTAILEQSMTTDKDQIISAIGKISQNEGSSNFVTGINVVGNAQFDFYNKQMSVVPMILLTDGFDDIGTQLYGFDGFNMYAVGFGNAVGQDVKNKFSSKSYIKLGDDALDKEIIQEINQKVFSLKSSFYKVEYTSTVRLEHFQTVQAVLTMEDKINGNEPQKIYYRNLLMFSPDEYKFENRLWTSSNQIIFRETVTENKKEALIGFVFYYDEPLDFKVFFTDYKPEFGSRNYSEYVESNTGEPKSGVELLEVDSEDWEVEEVLNDPWRRETVKMGIASVPYNYTEANKKKYMIIFSKNGSSWNYFDSADINE